MEWFDKFNWLHYEEISDTVFCIVCQNAKFSNKLSSSSKAEPTFITKGFCNWKEAQGVFREHESSQCHREAVQRVITLPGTTRDIGETLNEAHADEKAENRRIIRKVFENIQFPGRPGIPFRGNSGTEYNGNFL